jgi:hypothetical protein
VASSAKTSVPAPEPVPFVVPEGIDMECRSGKITGQPMYKVVGFNMPYMGSAESAYQVYQRLSTAYQTGFFNPAARK